MSRLALFAALTAAIAQPALADELGVMSFNVRTITGKDGPNRWEARRDVFADTIGQLHPDVIGTQELAKEQGDDTVARLPEYTWFGRDRFGAHADEHMGISAPKREGPENTFHDFTGKPTKRIDWILYRSVEAMSVQTVTTSKDGHYPSDHFPVEANFTL